MIGIYKITNPKGKVYIGQSLDIEKRFKEYRGLHCKLQPKIYNSLAKYTPEKHRFEILEICSKSKLNEREIYWGKKFDSIKKGLNLSLGKSTQIMSEETRNKISRANKGRTAWNKGKKGVQEYSEEFKDKIRKSRLGKKHSQETKEKISDTKKRLGIKPPSQKGKKRSPESIEKMKLAQRKRRLKLAH